MTAPARRPAARRIEAAPAIGAGRDVTLVVNTFNDLHFVGQAIESALAQTCIPVRIIVVDDGSDTDPGPAVAAYPGVQLVRKTNGGLASARNAGLAVASSAFILFLDADDRLLPAAIEAGLDCFSRAPNASFVFGAYREVDRDWRARGVDHFVPVGDSPYADLLKGNRIAMHATVLYRTAILKQVGGFDASLRLCEDYDVYLRIARRFPIACHSVVVAEYRRHGANISNGHRRMLDAAIGVLQRHRAHLPTTLLQDAWTEGYAFWVAYYRSEIAAAIKRTSRLRYSRARLRKDQLIMSFRYALPRRLRTLVRPILARRWPPRVGAVRLGNLGSTRPVSRVFGFDRGLPIDRGYIEDFLADHAADVRGIVLEIGDDAYCRRYGAGNIARQEVLHVHAGNPNATMVGELTDPSVVQDNSFDCVVLTQTLHLIYDFHAAIRRLHASLKQGGVALVTVPGITAIDRDEWRESWYWSFTQASIRRLFDDVFGTANVLVESFGNVYAAMLFLQGLSVAEADATKLSIRDEAYPVIVAVRAVKAA